VQSTLHQDPRPAESNRLVNLRADFVERPHISVGCAGPAIESAERTHNVADIRVVDIAVDDVGDYVVWMFPLPDFVGGSANCSDVMRFQQCGAFFGSHSGTAEHFLED
jgi:hypothetical protein